MGDPAQDCEREYALPGKRLTPSTALRRLDYLEKPENDKIKFEFAFRGWKTGCAFMSDCSKSMKTVEYYSRTEGKVKCIFRGGR
jgi:hypothetical protein